MVFPHFKSDFKFVAAFTLILHISFVSYSETTSYKMRRIIGSLSVINWETEEDAVMKLSPTRVIRAIAAKLRKWNTDRALIVTERKFDIISKEWKRILFESGFINTSVVVIQHKWSDHLYEVKKYRFPFQSWATIVLLTDEKLEMLFSSETGIEIHFYGFTTTQNPYVIVGRCLPAFISKFNVTDNVRMTILPVDTTKWLQGNITTKNITMYSIHRKNKQKWMTFPTSAIQTNKLSSSTLDEGKTSHGLLKNFAVYAQMTPVINIVEYKDGHLTGLIGDIATYMEDFLKFDFSMSILTEYEAFSLHQKLDIKVGSFLITEDIESYYLPVIFYDGLNVFSAKVELPMNLHTIICIFKPNVWIALLVVMLVINICFFTIAKESPLLQYQCKWKKNSIPTILRILCFDSLIRFHLECQQGPNPSAKCLLVALNYLSLMTTSIYLILFSAKVISNKPVFPYNSTYSACYDGNHAQIKMLYHVSTLDILSKRSNGWNNRSCLRDKDGSTRFAYMTTKDMFDRVNNGISAVIASDQLGSQMMRQFPHISKSEALECYYPVSMRLSRDFCFKEIFTRIVHQLREVGIIHKLQVRYLKLYGEDTVNIKATTFLETWFAFAILGIGILIALLVLVIEICAPLRV